jgi:hypothetical protein
MVTVGGENVVGECYPILRHILDPRLLQIDSSGPDGTRGVSFITGPLRGGGYE